jgi:phosphatidylethanolamine/phosphatidyl-N-methylethanolamine N-methyltransferase
MSHSSIARDQRQIRAHVQRRQSPARGRTSATRTLDSPLRFLSEFMREPLQVGAVWPSSRALARLVADCCEIKSGATVVELGPGTGAFTGPILKRMNGRGRFLAVEINSNHASILRRRFPQCEIIEDSAENLHRHLNGERADCIVSGLAWGTMLPRTQHQIFRAILKSLASGGQFIAFAYVHAAWLPTSWRFRQRLVRHFKRVETTPIVWRNLPPAFVFRCWRA